MTALCFLGNCACWYLKHLFCACFWCNLHLLNPCLSHQTVLMIHDSTFRAEHLPKLWWQLLAKRSNCQWWVLSFFLLCAYIMTLDYVFRVIVHGNCTCAHSLLKWPHCRRSGKLQQRNSSFTVMKGVHCSALVAMKLAVYTSFTHTRWSPAGVCVYGMVEPLHAKGW